jgi:Mn2+/Fe2+ NRAMP family transporter
LFAAGLAAAGLTSAITAPLAAGYAAAGAFPTKAQRVAKTTALVVVLLGTILAAELGASPQATIVAAQAANGMLLPFVAVFLLFVLNRSDLLGIYHNGWALNLAGGLAVGAAFMLGVKMLLALTR